MSISNELKAIRAHDMLPGLTNVNMGLVNSNMKKIKLIGAAAQVASLIKGQNVVTFQALEVAAGDLGIDENLLEKALVELQEIEFVDIKYSNGQIERVDEEVPILRDTYSIIGRRIQDIKLGEIEEAAIQVLDDLSLTPLAAVDLTHKHGFDAKAFGILSNIGVNTGFMDTYRSPTDSREILFSPIYWDENPAQMFKLLDQFGSLEVVKRLQSLRGTQGRPVDLLGDEILLQAVDLGCLPTPTVTSTAGEKTFTFTPITGVGKHEKSLLTKARAIIACLRYGEYYGTITKIKYPSIFLRSVLDNHGTKKSHHEMPQQWDLARKLGIGFFDQEVGYSGRYFFKLHMTPENIRAFEIAIQMLQIGDAGRGQEQEDDARGLLLPGNFTHPTVTRLKVKREASYTRDSVIHINDIIRGVTSDLFQ